MKGRVEVSVDGRVVKLRLTLGALAELEDELACDGLVALAERFDSGCVSARDVAAVLAAGLRGAGEHATSADVLERAFDDGAISAAKAASALLRAAFTGES